MIEGCCKKNSRLSFSNQNKMSCSVSVSSYRGSREKLDFGKVRLIGLKEVNAAKWIM